MSKGIFDQIYDRIEEAHNGRIYILPGNWIFPEQMPKGAQVGRASKDDLGRDMVIIHRNSVHCYNPDVGSPYPMMATDPNEWSVPHRVCKACGHYRKGSGKIRYPHCEWVRQQTGGSQGAASTFVGMVVDATHKAEAMLK